MAEITTYYRAYLQVNYLDKPEWIDCGWEFFENDPTEYLEQTNKENNIMGFSCRIKYLHIIHEQDYTDRKIYTKPIDQIIFH